MKDREKLAEFYMHNLTFTNLNFWDPNSSSGDMQVIDLASWMTLEDTRFDEIKKVMA